MLNQNSKILAIIICCFSCAPSLRHQESNKSIHPTNNFDVYFSQTYKKPQGVYPKFISNTLNNMIKKQHGYQALLSSQIYYILQDNFSYAARFEIDDSLARHILEYLNKNHLVESKILSYEKFAININKYNIDMYLNILILAPLQLYLIYIERLHAKKIKSIYSYFLQKTNLGALISENKNALNELYQNNSPCHVSIYNKNKFKKLLPYSISEDIIRIVYFNETKMPHFCSHIDDCNDTPQEQVSEMNSCPSSDEYSGVIYTISDRHQIEPYTHSIEDLTMERNLKIMCQRDILIAESKYFTSALEQYTLPHGEEKYMLLTLYSMIAGLNFFMSKHFIDGRKTWVLISVLCLTMVWINDKYMVLAL